MLERVMNLWNSSVRALLPQYPTDKTQIRIDGYDSDRVLIFGDGPAVGWGVESQDDALLGNLARELSALSGRGMNVDLVMDPFMTVEKAAATVQDLLIWRYDYVFIILGITDVTTLTTVNAWRRGMTELLAAVSDELAVSAQIVVASLPPISSIKQITWPFSKIVTGRAAAMNAATITLCETLPRVRYVEIPAATGSAMRNAYAILASQLAGSLARVMNDDEHLEQARHRPKRGDTIPPGEPLAQSLDRISDLASLAFQLKNPSIVVFDGDRELRADSTGSVLEEVSHSSGFAFNRHAEDMIIVGDTGRDRRFRTLWDANSDRKIRFYSSFPIESPLGVLLGNLCITDVEPRRRDRELDVASLRLLAGIALRDFWQYLPAQREMRVRGLF